MLVSPLWACLDADACIWFKTLLCPNTVSQSCTLISTLSIYTGLVAWSSADTLSVGVTCCFGTFILFYFLKKQFCGKKSDLVWIEPWVHEIIITSSRASKQTACCLLPCLGAFKHRCFSSLLPERIHQTVHSHDQMNLVGIPLPVEAKWYVGRCHCIGDQQQKQYQRKM